MKTVVSKVNNSFTLQYKLSHIAEKNRPFDLVLHAVLRLWILKQAVTNCMYNIYTPDLIIINVQF